MDVIPDSIPIAPDVYIENLIASWHRGHGGGKPLHEYLGLTREQYAAWVECRMSDEEAVALMRARSGAGGTGGAVSSPAGAADGIGPV